MTSNHVERQIFPLKYLKIMFMLTFCGICLRKIRHYWENAERNERQMLLHTTSFHCVITSKWQECAAIHIGMQACVTHIHYDFRQTPIAFPTPMNMCEWTLQTMVAHSNIQSGLHIEIFKSGKICGKHSIRMYIEEKNNIPLEWDKTI